MFSTRNAVPQLASGTTSFIRGHDLTPPPTEVALDATLSLPPSLPPYRNHHQSRPGSNLQSQAYEESTLSTRSTSTMVIHLRQLENQMYSYKTCNKRKEWRWSWRTWGRGPGKCIVGSILRPLTLNEATTCGGSQHYGSLLELQEKKRLPKLFAYIYDQIPTRRAPPTQGRL